MNDASHPLLHVTLESCIPEHLQPQTEISEITERHRRSFLPSAGGIAETSNTENTKINMCNITFY